ncbi:MAG: hypothetical protein ACR2MQ_13400, partial [Gemmatimonadaceae bacterium]
IKDNEPYFGDISKNSWSDAHDRARKKIGRGFPPDAVNNDGYKTRELTDDEFHRVLWRKDFRHFAALNWLRDGVPLNDVQLYMGLRNLSTLSKYLRIARPSEQGAAAAERAAERLGFALASTEEPS